MKSKFLLTTILLGSLFTLWDVPVRVTINNSNKAFAQEMKDATGMTPKQHIEMIASSKGKVGTGDAMRRFFFGDLEPIGIQPGGAGTVVNLYNKTNNVTFSYCSTFDVVVAVKQGKIAKFPPAEVK
ncbi:hypothetical protein G7B40_032590 [Aetokthonos hydrillicola Thurmond2011]|uniref:Uncharacterized protein n=1 Tax=Aetokthonos hydrillicola Thurmond2011 TaxID=2712845 RepID=A0AAP5IDH2_9CYAN|nr:hypothetical protein [Aetokthonos hydrillicola]MBO3462629.1 hypothetical protein [Aetokthonos hydrillicola CCALA 1050]MBW4585761.1 hypothetical protein [Aetokthonos hydrillicola CCALA 1050]MDR9899264.1 hypothetical protein [Aetokthonos hydrillicola Thurmond2011]